MFNGSGLAQPDKRSFYNEGKNMSREIVIVLPEHIEINGSKDAPENLRVISTANWDGDFCLTALTHGVSQKIGDSWSVGKKDVEKTSKIHEAMVAGDWTQRKQTGESSAKFEAKFDAAIAAMNVEALAGKLTREKLFELAKLAKADNVK